MTDQNTPTTVWPADEPAKTTEPAEAEVTEPTADDSSTEQAPENTETPSDEDTTAALKKARKESAERRVAAREAQEQADALRVELESTQKRLTDIQDRWLAEKLYTTGVGIEAFKAAGHGAHDVLNDNGNVDAAAFAKAVDDTASRFGRIGRIGGHVPSAGTGDPRPDTEHSWSSVIKGK